LIVRGWLSRAIHPDVLTFIGLVVNGVAAALLARTGSAPPACHDRSRAFDMVDGRVARETKQVTLFGGFFDSVVDRYRTWCC